MPPNLGGFFMVRSYYPSECHADYFDFERIEALKPAIEACGISTLSQSPMLGFHKQMDNRIKDRKSGSAGMPRPISYAVFCLKKKKANTGAHDLMYDSAKPPFVSFYAPVGRHMLAEMPTRGELKLHLDAR